MSYAVLLIVGLLLWNTRLWIRARELQVAFRHQMDQHDAQRRKDSGLIAHQLRRITTLEAANAEKDAAIDTLKRDAAIVPVAPAKAPLWVAPGPQRVH